MMIFIIKIAAKFLNYNFISKNVFNEMLNFIFMIVR